MILCICCNLCMRIVWGGKMKCLPSNVVGRSISKEGPHHPGLTTAYVGGSLRFSYCVMMVVPPRLCACVCVCPMMSGIIILRIVGHHSVDVTRQLGFAGWTLRIIYLCCFTFLVSKVGVKVRNGQVVVCG